MTVPLLAMPSPVGPRFRSTTWSSSNLQAGRTEWAVRDPNSNWVYVMGNYDRVQDAGAGTTEYTRSFLVRYSRVTGDLDTTWNPAPNGRLWQAIVSNDETFLVVVGEFTNILGSTRNRIAAINLSDGTLNARFASFTCNALVKCVTRDDGGGEIYYFGGAFTSIGLSGGSPRTRLAKFDLGTTTVALDATWTPTAASEVRSIKYDAVNNRVVMAMQNDGAINGSGTNKISSLSETTGASVWKANPRAGVALNDMDIDGTQCYSAVTGSGGQTVANLLTTGAEQWFYQSDGDNQAVCVGPGGYIYIGHHGQYVASVKNNTTANSNTGTSYGMYVLDSAGNLQMDWRPNFIQNSNDAFGGGVHKLWGISWDPISGDLYCLGDFTGVNPQGVTNTGSQTQNFRRFAQFETNSAPPPPPPGEQDAIVLAIVPHIHDSQVEADLTLSGTPDRNNIGLAFRHTTDQNYLFTTVRQRSGTTVVQLRRQTGALTSTLIAEATLSVIPPSSSPVDIGSTRIDNLTQADIFAQFQTNTGIHVDNMRSYGSTSNAAWSTSAYAPVRQAWANGSRALCSFKTPQTWSQVSAGAADTFLHQLFTDMAAAIGTNRMDITYHHEPDNDSQDGTVAGSAEAAALWIAAYRHVVGIARQHLPPAPQVRWAGCVYIGGNAGEASTAIPYLERWYPGDDVVDIIATDLYDGRNAKNMPDGNADPTRPHRSLADWTVYNDFSATHGKKWALWEFGTTSAFGTQWPNGEDRTAYINDVFVPGLRAYNPQNLQYVSYYNSKFQGPAGPSRANWAIYDEPDSCVAFATFNDPVTPGGSGGGGTYHVKTVYTGASVVVEVDGTQQLNVTLTGSDLSAPTGSGVGLRVYRGLTEDDGGSTFDNFTAGVPVTPTTQGTVQLFRTDLTIPSPATPPPDPPPPPPDLPPPHDDKHIKFKELRRQEFAAYKRALKTDHQVSTRVDLYDGDEKLVSSLSSPTQRVVEGSVDVDVTQDVARQLTVTIEDPGGKIDFDLRGNSNVWYDTFVSAYQTVHVPEIEAFVEVPLFFGPLSRFERGEHTVTLEALGKEALALEPATVWKPLRFPKRAPVVDVIREIMQGQGEHRFRFPELKERTNDRISIKRGAEAWRRVQTLANSVNRQLYYDGSGVLTMRARPAHVTYEFDYGENIVTVPTATHDALTELVNVVVVHGADASPGQKKVVAIAMPPSTHPLSPQSLSRRGDPRYQVEVIENSEIKRHAKAQKLARDTLDHHLKLILTGEFEALSAPHLDEHDIVRITAPNIGVVVPMQRWSIGLANATMTVGVNKRRTPRRRRGSR